MTTRSAPGSRGNSLTERLTRQARALAFGAIATVCASLLSDDAAADDERRLQPWSGPAPAAFTLTDTGGHSRSLSDRMGTVVLVHFFATWCKPCREELGSLRQLVERQKGDVAVLAVNVAEVPIRVRRFLETIPVNYPILLDPDRRVTKAWGVNGLPTTVVLDAEHTPHLYVEGDLDWTRADVIAALADIQAKPFNREEKQ